MAKLQKYDLLELPWTDIADYLKAGNDVVMIPVGSCEKHGHHVPLLHNHGKCGKSGAEGQGALRSPVTLRCLPPPYG